MSRWHVCPMNRIAHTTLEDGTEVSTIGADGMFVRYPETCVFYPNGSSDVVATYDSAADAFTGHHRIVENLVREFLGGEQA